MEEKDLDPSVYAFAEQLAGDTFSVTVPTEADIKRLAAAFQRAYEDWTSDIDADIAQRGDSDGDD